MSKYFFRNNHWGAPLSIWGAELGCYGTVRNKNSHNETNEKGNSNQYAMPEKENAHRH